MIPNVDATNLARRASECGSEGWGFETPRPPQNPRTERSFEHDHHALRPARTRLDATASDTIVSGIVSGSTLSRWSREAVDTRLRYVRQVAAASMRAARAAVIRNQLVTMRRTYPG